MENFIKILSPGLATIQDAGRDGYIKDGVPKSGAWNRTRYEEACLLLTGSREHRIPVIELLAGTCTFQSKKDVMMTIIGNASVTSKGSKAPVNSVFVLDASAPLSATHTGVGPVYIAIDGLVPPLDVLGSASWDSLSSLGNPPLKQGDIYELVETPYADTTGRFTRFKEEPSSTPIRIIPHHKEYLEILRETKWKVTQTSRIGAKLIPVNQLVKLKFSNVPSKILSYPTVQGLIQIPPSGEPVILGPDAGTAGGYATAGSVIHVDIPRLANLSPGTEILFTPVTVEEAEDAYHDYHKNLVYSVIDIKKYN